jgi:hypothetical protein
MTKDRLKTFKADLFASNPLSAYQSIPQGKHLERRSVLTPRKAAYPQTF